MVELNRNFGDDKLFNSPTHFLGVGQGTIINSEIIQRLGTFFPKVEHPSKFPDLHMTTIDIPDPNQDSLKNDLRNINDPGVKVWENVTFADNYYQTAVSSNVDSTETLAGSMLPGADLEIYLGGINEADSRKSFTKFRTP